MKSERSISIVNLELKRAIAVWFVALLLILILCMIYYGAWFAYLTPPPNISVNISEAIP